jgi:hypothetical protein
VARGARDKLTGLCDDHVRRQFNLAFFDRLLIGEDYDVTGVLAKPFDTILGGGARQAAVEKADAETQAAIRAARRQRQAVLLEAENEQRPQGHELILVGADSPTTPFEGVGWSQNNIVELVGLEPTTF